MSSKNTYQDDVIVLKTKNWQTADRIAEGYSREHGRILFIAYGARHMRNRNSALVQNLTHGNMQFSSGQKFDTLRQCELLEPVVTTDDITRLAYAAFISELTAEITPERQPQEEIYFLLVAALKAVNVRNPRLVALSFSLKLLELCGTQPSFSNCVCCGRAIEGDARASAIQGGCVCDNCKTGAEPEFGESTQLLAATLSKLDLQSEDKFVVKGRDIIMLEEFLHKFIFVQIEKPLQSLKFLATL